MNVAARKTGSYTQSIKIQLEIVVVDCRKVPAHFMSPISEAL